MRHHRSLALAALIAATVVAASCRLGESPDDFVGGGAAAAGGGTSGSGGSGGTGLTGGTAGSTVGTGGGGENYVACASTPSECSDIGSEDVDLLYGCCDGDVLYWCENDGSGWEFRTQNCATTNEVCNYVQLQDRMGCTEGSGGTGGGSACESGECEEACKDCDDSGECLTDTNSDPDHCGECDHSCLGGTCSGGNCQPVVLAPNQNTPWGLTVDDGAVYWLTEGGGSASGSVSTVPISGGKPVELIGEQNGPVQITMDGEYLYWTSFGGGGAVRRMSTDGSDLIEFAQASGPWAIALGLQFVYWTNTSDGSIRRDVRTGGQSKVLISGEDAPRGITVNKKEGHIYWSTSTGGQIRTCTANGQDPKTVVSNEAYPLGIAVGIEWVYWTELGDSYSLGDCDQADGRIRRARLGGTDVETLADNQACPMNLTLYPAEVPEVVFWTNAGTVTGSTYNYDGTVQSLHVEEDTSTLIASGQDRPYGITVTEEAVYWTNQGVFSGQGSVMKIAR